MDTHEHNFSDGFYGCGRSTKEEVAPLMMRTMAVTFRCARRLRHLRQRNGGHARVVFPRGRACGGRQPLHEQPLPEFRAEPARPRREHDDVPERPLPRAPRGRRTARGLRARRPRCPFSSQLKRGVSDRGRLQ